MAFPLGGIGAGMICLEGSGALSHVSLRNRPEVFNEPCTFAAIAIKGPQKIARVLQGPVPGWKLFGTPGSGNGGGRNVASACRGSREAVFTARFPFATVRLSDSQVPLEVELTAWSPFEPGDADDSSLPVAALEYRFTNHDRGDGRGGLLLQRQEFHGRPWAHGARREPAGREGRAGGFVLWGGGGPRPGGAPWEELALSATVSEPGVRVNHAWFRGGWFDPLTMAWKDVAAGACFDRPPVSEGGPSPGATLFVPLTIAPGASTTVVLRLAWYAGRTNLHEGKTPPPKPGETIEPGPYRPWYAGRFAGIEEVTAHWREQYDALRAEARRFSDCFYDSTLPPEVIEAVAANLTILKSPTVLRQADGRLWSWEGCNDNAGCCAGSCTHVWNYAQAVPHLFPALERTLRETEFGPSQDERGPPDVPQRAARSGRSYTTSTPRPTANWAAS